MDIINISKKRVLNRITTLMFVLMSFVGISTASADMIGSTPTLTITGTVGNTVTSTNLPQVIALPVIDPGQELTNQNVNLTFLSSGFGQTFTGNVNVNVNANSITVTFSGTAQGVALTFSFDNLNGGTGTCLINSASTSASSGIVSGVNALITPTFSGNTAAFGFNFFGFQPGTNVSHTMALAFDPGVCNNPPTITSAATATVDDNQTSAIDVQSTDDNDSEGSGLTYTITGGADQALFNINANTGVLTFASAPNFNSPGDVGGNNIYDVQVSVTDSGSLTDVQVIAITVESSNSAPNITSSATATVNENQTSAIDVQSTDDNDSEASGLTYSKTGGADQALFNINASTGVLSFASAPNFEAPGDAGDNNVYDVQITVTDSGTLTDVQDIAITVQNVNEAPNITSSGSATVNENQTGAINVQSTDDTNSEGSGLTYSISGGSDQTLFSIVAGTGVLTFITAPDFEAPGDATLDNVYAVQVTVTDSGSLTDVQNLAITVQNVNEAPNITSSGSATVNENQTDAINVQSTDDTNSEGSGLTYSKTGGADQALFNIDASTGCADICCCP